VKSEEGYIEVDGGRVWYRSVGEGGTPLLCLHGGPGFSHYCLEPLEALAAVRQVISEHEAAGFTACPEYQAAILGFYREHVCRLSPWPASLERSFAEAGYPVYNAMNGPSEFSVTGTLRTWDVMDRLGEIGRGPCWWAAATTSAARRTWRRCTGASPGRGWPSSRTPRTCASPSSRRCSPSW
jgi:hypothetical protein